VTTIGDYAFEDCSSLTSIKIPSGVTTIGNGVFEFCSSLISIEVDSANVNYKSIEGILYKDDTLLCCPEGKTGSVKIAEGVTTIEGYAFLGCSSLTSIEIPSGVTTIGEGAFLKCSNLTSIQIPESVTDIGDRAIGYEYDDNWNKIQIENFTLYGYLGTAAETYAKENNITFISLDEEVVSKPFPFEDVQNSSWYYNSVKYCYDYGYISGTTATTFSPSTKITRGMMVTILWNIAGKPKAGAANPFSDLTEKNYYYNAAVWAASVGVINGYKDGTFRGGNSITREELAIMVRNYSQKVQKNYKKATVDLTTYKDYNKVASYAQTAIQWAVANKVISGKNNGVALDPKGYATRAEAVAIITNYLKNVK
jgi:hypothetical protein